MKDTAESLEMQDTQTLLCSQKNGQTETRRGLIHAGHRVSYHRAQGRGLFPRFHTQATTALSLGKEACALACHMQRMLSKILGGAEETGHLLMLDIQGQTEADFQC